MVPNLGIRLVPDSLSNYRYYIYEGNTYLRDTLDQSGRAIRHDMLIRHRLCGMNPWPSGRVLASAYCGCWFDLQWWRSRCALLMRPNKVETAVQCSVCHMQVFAGFSCHGNSKITSIPPFKKNIYNYIYIYVCVYIYIYIYIYIPYKFSKK